MQVFDYKNIRVIQCLHTEKVTSDTLFLAEKALLFAKPGDKILEIGSGTGLISLLMAQTDVLGVDAIDLNKSAYECSKLNFENNPCKHKLKAFHSSYQDFYKNTPNFYYDLIVCNPPYVINEDQFRTPERKLARSEAEFDLGLFLELSSMKGKRVMMVFPEDQYQRIILLAMVRMKQARLEDSFTQHGRVVCVWECC